MKKQIETFIKDLKSNKKLNTFDKASTKQAVVLRLLSFLEWDIFNVDEVAPDYAVNSHSVAYSLRINNTNKVFIEVKRINEKLDNHQKPLLGFASREGVNVSILTNGIVWWFYLTSATGSSHEKWFYSVDLLKQKTDDFIPQLIDLLSKNKVARGQALKTAKTLNQNKKQKMASDIIPEAWNKIISQPNMIFVELLRETTEKICGYKIEAKIIERFLEKNLDKWLMSKRPSASASPPPKIIELANVEEKPKQQVSTVPSKTSVKKAESYAGKEIKSYSFNGNTSAVRNWEDMLTSLCDYFAMIHSKDFEKVLWISGEDHTYFSRYSDQLKIPEKIKGTNIYVETKLSSEEIVRTSRLLLAEFGYHASDLKITTI